MSVTCNHDGLTGDIINLMDHLSSATISCANIQKWTFRDPVLSEVKRLAPLHPWEWPSKPWSRLDLDFAGPFLGHNYLVLVDSHSKWMDVQLMTSTNFCKNHRKTPYDFLYSWITSQNSYGQWYCFYK